MQARVDSKANNSVLAAAIAFNDPAFYRPRENCVSSFAMHFAIQTKNIMLATVLYSIHAVCNETYHRIRDDIAISPAFALEQ